MLLTLAFQDNPRRVGIQFTVAAEIHETTFQCQNQYSAAELFRWTGRKVLPRVGITDTFAERQVQHSRFCRDDNLLSFKGY